MVEIAEGDFVSDEKLPALLEQLADRHKSNAASGSSVKDQASRLQPRSKGKNLVSPIAGATQDEGDSSVRYRLSKNSRIPRKAQSTRETRSPIIKKPSEVPLRGLPVEEPLISLEQYDHNGVVLYQGDAVELHDDEYLLISDIIHNPSLSQVILRGWSIKRTKYLDIFLTSVDVHHNDLYWECEIDLDDERRPASQSLVNVNVSEVVRPRNLRLTNRPWSSLEDGTNSSGGDMQEGILSVRKKYVSYYVDSKARNDGSSCRELVDQLRHTDIPTWQEDFTEESHLREIWRGPTTKGGSCLGLITGEREFLRQERVSSTGKQSYQSLQTNQRDFPRGDPMERDSVGTIIIGGESTDDESSDLENLVDPWVKNATSMLDILNANRLADTYARGKGRKTRRRSARFSVTDQYSHEVKVGASVKKSNHQGSLKRKYESQSTVDFILTSKRAASLGAWSERSSHKSRQFDVVDLQESEVAESASDIGPRSWTDDIVPDYPPRETAPSLHTGITFQSELEASWSGANARVKYDKDDPFCQYMENISITPEKTLLGTSRLATTASASPRASDYGLPDGKGQRYTMFDCFCGAGGWSRGAVMAGLRVMGGFDSNNHACDTYSRNFVGANVYNMSVEEFIRRKGDFFVDLIHISFVCKTWSPMHTREGKDDEENIATLFCVALLLEKFKPRIMTIENTPGLSQRHQRFFREMIQMITSKDYNVTWAILTCADYGVPQLRRRLFVIASCPGEVLPDFPPPTHSKNPATKDLKPWVTINETIKVIPDGWPDHDPEEYTDGGRPPRSGDKLAPTLLTSNPDMYHPSGKRPYTNRELMCLQTFPLCHKMSRYGVKIQNGNAVPPTMACVLLEWIKGYLLRADGLA